MSTSVFEAGRRHDHLEPKASGSQRRGFSLLVSNDELLAGTIRDVAQRFNVVLRARTQEQALTMLPRSSNWAGIVVDLDESGPDTLAALQRLRGAERLVPILALSKSSSRDLINALHLLRVELLVKPIEPSNLMCFMRRALVMGWFPDERVAAWVDTQAITRRLTNREVQLIAYALGRESREQIMRRLGITENTLKTQIRSLLRKCGARSMDGLAVKALRESLILEQQSAAAEVGPLAREAHGAAECARTYPRVSRLDTN